MGQNIREATRTQSNRTTLYRIVCNSRKLRGQWEEGCRHSRPITVAVPQRTEKYYTETLVRLKQNGDDVDRHRTTARRRHKDRWIRQCRNYEFQRYISFTSSHIHHLSTDIVFGQSSRRQQFELHGVPLLPRKYFPFCLTSTRTFFNAGAILSRFLFPRRICDYFEQWNLKSKTWFSITGL